MLLSRKWLNEFVPVEAKDRAFAEDMTLSGSKVEVTEVEGEEISNVVVGRVVEIKRHGKLRSHVDLSGGCGRRHSPSNCHRGTERFPGGLGPGGQR